MHCVVTSFHSVCLIVLGVAATLVTSALGAENDKADSRHPGGLGVTMNNAQQCVVVVEVIAGSPAQLADVRQGDQIFYVGDRRVRNTQEMMQEVAALNPGTQVQLVVMRNGQRHVLNTTLGDYESIFGRRYSYNPVSANTEDTQQQIRTLQQRVDGLNRELNRVRATQSSFDDEVRDMLEWHRRGGGQRGGTGNDPIIFQ
jgi:predicted metalloprotease with PDZ domain